MVLVLLLETPDSSSQCLYCELNAMLEPKVYARLSLLLRKSWCSVWATAPRLWQCESHATRHHATIPSDPLSLAAILRHFHYH